MRNLLTKIKMLLFAVFIASFLATGCVSVNKAISPALPALTAPLDGLMIDITDVEQRSATAYKQGAEKISYIYIQYQKGLEFKVLEDLTLVGTQAGTSSTSLNPGEIKLEALKPGDVIKYPLYDSNGSKNINYKDLYIK
jgi:outer membrane murein-binding lipoprotein Lpp